MLATGDIIEMTFRSLWQEQRILLVTHWRATDVPGTGLTSENLDRLCEVFSTSGAGTPLDTYAAMLGDDVTIESVRAQRVSPLRSLYVQRAMSFSGNAGGDAEAGNLAGVITHRTELPGRRQVATRHLGPIATTDVSNGLVTVGWLTRAGAFATRWRQPVVDVTGGFTLLPVIYHRDVAPPDDWNDITNSILQDTVRTMHRRTLRIGE